MRFLFTVQPLFGHFHSMVPLARALKDRGHDVAFATGKDFAPTLQHVGFQHFPCGLDFNTPHHVLATMPEWQAMQDIQSSDPARQLAGFIRGFAPRMADDLIELMNTWKPDAIVRDPIEFGGYIAAEKYGLPYASVMWALYIPPQFLCPDTLIELRRRYGLPADPKLETYDRYMVLTALPPSWTMPGIPVPPVTHRHCTPPFDLSNENGLPDWVHTLPDQPTVYATLGTTFNQAPDIFRAIIAAFSTEPINLIMTVGRSVDPTQFRPLPDHIHVEQYIPQSLILPHCDALIFHGGYNSLLSALWNELPVVITPMGAGDQRPTGYRCAELGLGVLIENTAPEVICTAVKTVLEQPAYRARVQTLFDEIKALPDLSVAVQRLETLARTKEPQFN